MAWIVFCFDTLFLTYEQHIHDRLMFYDPDLGYEAKAKILAAPVVLMGL